jgi:phage gp29-like protein
MTENLEGIKTPEQTDNSKVTNQHFAEVGITGLKRSGGYVQEEFLTNLVMPQCLKVYKEMASNDPVIGAILFVFEQLARKVTWRITPGGNKSEDLKITEFVDSCRKDMSHSWDDLITDILSEFEYGWAWHEIVFKIRGGDVRNPKFKSKYNDKKIGWRKIAGRSQDSWHSWIFDEEDELVAMIQQAQSDFNTRIIPFNKSLLFRTKANRGNPEGRSLLRNAYRPWFFKKHIEEIEAIGIERDLAGLPQLNTPENVDIWSGTQEATQLKNTLETIISNVRRDQNEGLIFPHGYEFQLVSTGGRRQIDTNAIINRYDQRIAVTMLSDLVMLGADKVGSFALADVKKSLLATALEAQIKSIAEVFNTYAIPQLIKLNNFKGFTDYPKLVSSEIETPNLKSLGDFLVQLKDLGVDLFPDENLESYVRSAAELPEKSKIKEKPKEKSDSTESKGDEGKTHRGGPTGEDNQSDDKTKFNELYSREGRK